ncbi:hypothetical protein HYV84_03475, partial [Candidatus Woesearchaeota archaeon]|nr:hypothetical protein [Candidatus Woesearchaeota archaeon]
ILYIIYPKKKEVSLKYLLGILNSSVINYYYHKLYSMVHISGGYLRFFTPYVKQIPIRFNESYKTKIIVLVEEIEDLYDKLSRIKDKQTDQKAQLEKEIQKLDAEIDEEVYNLYGITEEEKKIIEGSLNRNGGHLL